MCIGGAADDDHQARSAPAAPFIVKPVTVISRPSRVPAESVAARINTSGSDTRVPVRLATGKRAPVRLVGRHFTHPAN